MVSNPDRCVSLRSCSSDDVLPLPLRLQPAVEKLPEPLRSMEPGTWAYDTMSRRVNEEILERTWQDCIDDFQKPSWKAVEQKFQALRHELSHAGVTRLAYLDAHAPATTTAAASTTTATTDRTTTTTTDRTTTTTTATTDRTTTTATTDTDAPAANGIVSQQQREQERQREIDEWNAILQPHVEAGETWLSAPWMVAEFFVYRRLMDCLDYWNEKSPAFLYDPFEKPKRAGLTSSVTSAEAVLAKILTLPAAATATTTTGTSTSTTTIATTAVALSIPLWGNKMDLSLWPADAKQADRDVFSAILAAAHENLLHDDSEIVGAYCQTLLLQRPEKSTKTKSNDGDGIGGGNIDIIVDNAGFELVTDLALAQYLISSGIAKTVTFQLKSHPTFVSDALEKDLRQTVDYYCNLDSQQYPNAQKSGLLWNEYLETGQWKCQEHSFWVQGAPMWEMPADLRMDLSQRCDLAIVKGDANYRRLLGDLQWPYSSPPTFQDVVGSYFPCPVCALRTLKAELGCGMDAEQVQRASSLDPNWLVNGRFGVVQFGTGTNGRARAATATIATLQAADASS